MDEDDIKEWHSSPTTQGIDVEPEDYGGELNKLWVIGGRLLAHLESDDESEEDSEQDSEGDGPAVRTGTGSNPTIRTAAEESDGDEEGTEESDDEEVPVKPTAPTIHTAETAVPPPTLSSSAPTARPREGPSNQTEESEEENSEDDESEDEDDLPTSKKTVAVKPQATPRSIALPKQGAGEGAGESEGETDDDDSEERTPAQGPHSAAVGTSQNRPTKPIPPSVLAKPSTVKLIATQEHQTAEKGKAVAAPATGESDDDDDDDDEDEDEDDDESEDETHAVLAQ